MKIEIKVHFKEKSVPVYDVNYQSEMDKGTLVGVDVKLK
jgi:hypothetical protein